MKKLLYAISCCIIVSACMMMSCTPSFDEAARFHSIGADGWIYGDTLEFDSDLPDSVTDGRIAIAVRHTGAYIYGNLYVEIVTPLPGDTVERIDTVNIPLADIYGKWYGRGTGVSFVTTDTLPGQYHIVRGKPVKVRHIMRVDTLADIEQIGIIFINQPVK